MVTVKHTFHDISSWLEIQKDYFTLEEIDQFNKAIAIADTYYSTHKFYPTDINLLKHALNCAATVANLNLYSDAVIATILFALPKFCPKWKDELKEFDNKVVELIEGVNRVTQIRKLGSLPDVENSDEKKEQIETIRKMLLAMASDIRVVLIVLVGRGELMLHLKSCKDEAMQRKIALETVEIFAPLANRLGVSQIKWELEDLSFKYLHPEQYKKIANLLDETRQERLEYIVRIKEFLSTQMDQGNIAEYEITGRAKHIYSIWKKMKKKNYDFTDLYDILAVRVLVSEVKDCYTVLGIVHTKYSPIPGEFDDYISNPKSNNYQSLHTCVTGPENKIVEIQIRTFAMHDHAEYGVAAHWRYKEFDDKHIENTAIFAEKVAWLRQLLDWREELTERKDITDIFKNEIFNDAIYAMTPNGKVISLPRGSTPIDFAYALHSEIGHKCRGAKIDGVMAPLATPLQNGQQVEILTAKEGGPSINWLYEGLVKSSKAISHIRRYIRSQNNEEYLASGLDLFERELTKFPTNNRPNLSDILLKLGYSNEKTLYIDLGKGVITPIMLKEALNRLLVKPEEPQAAADNEELLEKTRLINIKPDNRKISSIIVNGVTGIITHTAKCCKPIPGDEIIGFITQNSGIAIHRDNCISFNRHAKLYPAKVVPVSWSNKTSDLVFNADIEIIANDRSGLLRDLTDLFAIERLHITGLKTSCKNNKSFMVFTLKIKSSEFNFSSLINKIFAITGVIEVARK